MFAFDFFGVAGVTRSGSIPKAVKLCTNIENNPLVYESPERAARYRDVLNLEYGAGTFAVFGLTIELHEITLPGDPTPGSRPANIKSEPQPPEGPESPHR
jgi:hypothetical protein